MSGAEVNKERTVLYYLNEYCWQAVLDYVPVRDIILSETVSRRWQQMVLMYLIKQRINIDMEGICLSRIRVDPPANVRSVTLWLHGPLRTAGLPETSKTFKLWLHKLSPAVVGSWCNSKRMYRAIRHCPNLESLTLVGLKYKLSVKQNENINRVRQLSFVQCTFSDKCINQFTRNNLELEELGVYRNDDMHGLCLSNMISRRLKILIFSECTGLMSSLLIPAVSLLKGLTKLVLHKVPRGVYDKVHLLLNNMPCLEHLAIHTQLRGLTEVLNEKNLQYMDAVCRLGSLEHLALAHDASNDDIEAVTRHCTKLRRLEIVNCYRVTGCGLAAVCRNMGARLEVLDATECGVRDDDVVGVVRHCPNLTSLNLQLCGLVSGALVPRAAAARRELRARSRLRLHLGHTCMWRQLDEYKEKYKDELIMQY